jgi:hypothetical protein
VKDLLFALWYRHDTRVEHMKLCKIVVVVILMQELKGLFLIPDRTALEPDSIAG